MRLFCTSSTFTSAMLLLGMPLPLTARRQGPGGERWRWGKAHTGAHAAGTGARSRARAEPCRAEPSHPPAAGGGRRPRPAPTYPSRRGGPTSARLKGRAWPPAPRVFVLSTRGRRAKGAAGTRGTRPASACPPQAVLCPQITEKK